jgi:hypothetical protein
MASTKIEVGEKIAEGKRGIRTMGRGMDEWELTL